MANVFSWSAGYVRSDVVEDKLASAAPKNPDRSSISIVSFSLSVPFLVPCTHTKGLRWHLPNRNLTHTLLSLYLFLSVCGSFLSLFTFLSGFSDTRELRPFLRSFYILTGLWCASILNVYNQSVSSYKPGCLRLCMLFTGRESVVAPTGPAVPTVIPSSPTAGIQIGKHQYGY